MEKHFFSSSFLYAILAKYDFFFSLTDLHLEHILTWNPEFKNMQNKLLHLKILYGLLIIKYNLWHSFPISLYIHEPHKKIRAPSSYTLYKSLPCWSQFIMYQQPSFIIKPRIITLLNLQNSERRSCNISVLFLLHISCISTSPDKGGILYLIASFLKVVQCQPWPNCRTQLFWVKGVGSSYLVNQWWHTEL